MGAGPYLGLLSSAVERFQAELQLESDPRATEPSFKREVTDRYKTTDFGLVVEASGTITKPRRGMGLVFHIRYQGGLTNVLREYLGPLAVLPPGPYRNSVIQAYVSFPFVH